MKQRTRQELRRAAEARAAAAAEELKQAPDDLEVNLEAIVERLRAEEKELGLEYVGPNRGLNRSQRRQAERDIKRLTRRPAGCRTMLHPALKTWTPYGLLIKARRRRAARLARTSRKRNR